MALDVDDVMPIKIIVNLKLLNQRVYRNACAIALLRGHENLEEFVNDIFLDRLEMYPEGRERLEDCIDWGFKTRDQMRHESSSRNEKKGEIVP